MKQVRPQRKLSKMLADPKVTRPLRQVRQQLTSWQATADPVMKQVQQQQKPC